MNPLEAILSGVVGLGLAALVVVLWAGVLYHRTLSLPEGRREHGLRVLAELTHLCEAFFRRQPGK